MNQEKESKSFVESLSEQPKKDQQNFEHLEELIRIADNIFDAVMRDPSLDPKMRLKLVEIFAATELDMKLEQREILDKYKDELTELTGLSRQKLSEENFVGEKEEAIELVQAFSKSLAAQANITPHEILLVNEVPVLESARKRNIIFNQIGGNKFLRLATVLLMLSTSSAVSFQKLFAQEVEQKEPETEQTPESKIEESKIEILPLDAEVEAKLVKEFPVEKSDKLNSNYLYFSVRDLLELFQYTNDSEWREDFIFLRGLNNNEDYSDDPKIVSKLNELEKFYKQNRYDSFNWEWWSEPRKNDYLASKFTQDELLHGASARKQINDRYAVISNPVVESGNIYLTLTILDLKNKAVKSQIKILFDPQKFEDLKNCTPEQINIYIFNQVIAQIKNDKNIENLNNVAVLANDCKISVDQKKYDLLAERERENLEKGANLIQEAKIGVYVLSGGAYYSFDLELGASQLKQPFKINGKLHSLSFALPKGYRVEINGRAQQFYVKKEGLRQFDLGQIDKLIVDIGGSAEAVSQDQIVELVIKNENGKMVGSLLFEQMTAFYMGGISMKRGADKKTDSLNFYITDLDTLQTFQKIGKEQYLEDMKETAYGVIQLEEYFKHNFDVRSFYLGGDTDVDNAFFNSAKNERSLFFSAAAILAQGRSRRSKDIYRLTGRHEALHKFDWSLGPNTIDPDDHYYSLYGAFGLLFEKESEDLSRLLEKVQQNKTLSEDERDKIFKDHFLFLISENKFFDDEAAAGHAFSGTWELFASLLNSLFEEPAKWEAKIKSWSPENQQKYLKSLVIVEKVLRKKGVDTSNLQKDIAKLRKIINK